MRPPHHLPAVVVAPLLVAAVWLLAVCGSNVRPYPLAEPLTEDPDRTHVPERPERYRSPFWWDWLDNSTFRPMTRFFAAEPAGPAVNVNAVDEVPNSSWFENRIGLGNFSVEQARRGSCPDVLIDTSGPWMVTDAKTEGANPGFFIEAPDGRRYLLKFDGLKQPLRATSADVFGSRLYYAVGFHAPCNFIVFFDPDILEVAPDAEAEDAAGNAVPMTEAHVRKVLDAAFVLEDGRYRASASLFLPGRPIGPWRYEGIREDDPNDSLPHEDRRELRGARLVAAWINHFDAREANTLSMWVEEDEDAHYVMHYYIDFGDSFGSMWDWDALSRRLGHAYYFDFGDFFSDFLALGAIPRPWHQVERSDVAPSFGYFEAAHFDPQDWRPGYPNPAFSRMRDGDGAWMARIVAHFTDAHVRAMLDEAQISLPDWDAELYRILLARRDRILEEYLLRRSPLTHFEVRPGPTGEELCGVDLAVRTDVVREGSVRYRTRMYFDDFEEPAWAREEATNAADPNGTVCVRLEEDGLRPAAEAGDAPPDSLSRYAVLDVIAIPEPGAEPVPPARLHFYDLADGGFRLVGIERPGDDAPPGNP